MKLYLGLRFPKHLANEAVHHPIITIVPKVFDKIAQNNLLKELLSSSHLLFTSQTAVELIAKLYSQIATEALKGKMGIAVGKKTALMMKSFGMNTLAVAKEETAEGVIALFEEIMIDKARSKIFWPHSVKSRDVLKSYFQKEGYCFVEYDLYDTVTNFMIDKVDLALFDEIIFSSSSTVDAFLERYKQFPAHARLTPIGPITAERISSSLGKR